MPLSPEEKRQNRIDRMVDTMRQYQLQRCVSNTAKALQKAIRAEYACRQIQPCMSEGRFVAMLTLEGECVCVTCGVGKPWNASNHLGSDGIDAGHFLGGRCNAIILDERGIHPQCTACNRNGGNPEMYNAYMLHRYGQEVIDELKRAKAQKRVTYTRHELAERRVDYLDRIKAAERRMSDV